MPTTYYKVVAKRGNKYFSACVDSVKWKLEYSKQKWTVPKEGFCFIFNSLKACLSFLGWSDVKDGKNNFYCYRIFKCVARQVCKAPDWFTNDAYYYSRWAEKWERYKKKNKKPVVSYAERLHVGTYFAKKVKLTEEVK